MDETIKLRDESGDRDYFFMVPHIVMNVVESPAQLSLWCTIKMVTGESGECTLNTDQLSALAMISKGAVSQERKRLLELGLIAGSLQRDEGFPQRVWHLSVPDIWQMNVGWRRKFRSLKNRIQLKIEQREELKRLKEEEAKPIDRGSFSEVPPKKPDDWLPSAKSQMVVLTAGSVNSDKFPPYLLEEKQRMIERKWGKLTKNLVPACTFFLCATGIDLPLASERSDWRKTFGEHVEYFGESALPELYAQAYLALEKKGIKAMRPGALTLTMRSIVEEQKKAQKEKSVLPKLEVTAGGGLEGWFDDD